MTMIRIVIFSVFCLAAAAQAPDITALQAAAQAAETEWLRLAQDMDARLSRMLPCDARAARAIQEVSSASATRLAAHAQYVAALIEAAVAETEAARTMATAQRNATSGIAAERADIAQEQAGLESQISNLSASVAQRASLGPALEQLQEIQKLIAQRAAAAGNQPGSDDRTAALWTDLVSGLEKRGTALRLEAAAFEAERTRWNAYYAARADRARLECSITGGGR